MRKMVRSAELVRADLEVSYLAPMGRAFWNSTMQLRVELRDITTPIWRRLVVPAECGEARVSLSDPV